MDPQEEPAELSGVGRYRRRGAGPVVLVLSNPQADPSWWATSLSTALVGAGYEVVTFVHTGPGTSPPEVADDVARLVEHLDAGPVRLLGWSQGAAIAQETTVRHAHLVTAAVLIAPYGRQNAMDRVLQEAWATLHRAGDELDPVRLAMLLLTSYPAAQLGDDAVAAPVIEAVRQHASRAGADPDAQRRAAEFITGYQDRLPGLSGVRVPCLVIGFHDDADTFVVRAREVAAALPDSRYVELADAGHLAPVDQPDRVAAPVLEFLTALDAPGRAGPG